MSDDDTTKVKVAGNFQVSYAGKQYGPGETAEVPRQLAKNWLLWGWVEEVKSSGRSRTRK